MHEYEESYLNVEQMCQSGFVSNVVICAMICFVLIINASKDRV